jgi:hypothetical protein
MSQQRGAAASAHAGEQGRHGLKHLQSDAVAGHSVLLLLKQAVAVLEVGCPAHHALAG